jgi:hypothetical protein
MDRSSAQHQLTAMQFRQITAGCDLITTSCKLGVGGHDVPQVTIKTGFISPDGTEETLTTYLCDAPDCPHPAVEVLGAIRELGTSYAVCKSHAAALQKRRDLPPR